MDYCFQFSSEISQNQCSKPGKSMNNKITIALRCGNPSILRIIHLKLLLGKISHLKGDLRNYTVMNGMENVDRR